MTNTELTEMVQMLGVAQKDTTDSLSHINNLFSTQDKINVRLKGMIAALERRIFELETD